jgi:hypothetical protein
MTENLFYCRSDAEDWIRENIKQYILENNHFQIINNLKIKNPKDPIQTIIRLIIFGDSTIVINDLGQAYLDLNYNKFEGQYTKDYLRQSEYYSEELLDLYLDGLLSENETQPEISVVKSIFDCYFLECESLKYTEK